MPRRLCVPRNAIFLSRQRRRKEKSCVLSSIDHPEKWRHGGKNLPACIPPLLLNAESLAQLKINPALSVPPRLCVP